MNSDDEIRNLYSTTPGGIRRRGQAVLRTLKSGEYVRHNLTGQVFTVKEHGRGNDYLLRPAYKSDGVWVGRAEVTPCADPHPWNWTHALRVLVVLALTVWAGWDTYNTLAAHHVGSAWAYTVTNGMFVLVAASNFFGLSRP